jgi:hypothetical protein
VYNERDLPVELHEGNGYLGHNINGEARYFISPSAFVKEKGKYAIGIFVFK